MVASPVVMRMPWWTLGVTAAMLLAHWLPGIADFLVYDRAGIAGGELWRFVTGHLVHFSGAHLVANIAVLVPAALLVETRYRRDAGPLFVGGAFAIGVALFIWEPGILEFGGASGVTLAVLVYTCLRGLKESRRWRAVCVAVLLVLGAKIAAEMAGWSLRNWQDSEGFVPVMLSHVVGAATGAIFYLWRTCGGRTDYCVGAPPVDDSSGTYPST